jgi:hypothetical protein
MKTARWDLTCNVVKSGPIQALITPKSEKDVSSLDRITIIPFTKPLFVCLKL